MQNAPLICTVKVKYATSLIKYIKQVKNQCLQNATPVEETLQRVQNATLVEETQRKRSNATPVEETLQRVQNATPVEETIQKRSNATPVKETTPMCSKHSSCRRNRASVFRMQTLSHKLHLSRQSVKFCRNLIKNKHRICNHLFIYEALQKSCGNEHRVCNH